MKQLVVFLVKNIMLGIVGLVIFAGLLRTPLFVKVPIYYYRTLYLVGIVAVLLLIFLVLNNQKKLIKCYQMSVIEITSSILIVTLGMTLMVTVASMPIDRSYTIYSLAEMATSRRIYTADEIEATFIQGYIKDMGATKRRIEEQVALGNLEEIDGKYRISQKGERLVEIFRLYESIFPVSERRLLYPSK